MIDKLKMSVTVKQISGILSSLFFVAFFYFMFVGNMNNMAFCGLSAIIFQLIEITSIMEIKTGLKH